VQGEKAVAELLGKRTADSPVIVLHNRRMPGGRGDIDHIAIAPIGVHVIDTKDLHGSVRVDRPWFGEPKVGSSNLSRRVTKIAGIDRVFIQVLPGLCAVEILRGY
jgi:hypothetical protein